MVRPQFVDYSFLIHRPPHFFIYANLLITPKKRRELCPRLYCLIIRSSLLLNFTVCESSKSVMPWRIKVVDPPNLTFSQFFQALEVIDLELSQTFVGRAKN